MPFNDTAKNVALDALDESATQITHVGVATSAVDPGTGTNSAGTEATGGGGRGGRGAVPPPPTVGPLHTVDLHLTPAGWQVTPVGVAPADVGGDAISR